jgi:hypothetical protein
LKLKDQAPHVLPRGAFLRMTLKIAEACVKATSQSSTARPQEKQDSARSTPNVMAGLVPAITK